MKHVFCAVGAAVMALGASSVEVKVDFGRETGPVKPVNGVGQPPPAYFAAQGENGDFLLKHAVVAKPQDCGSDVPLVCGDYYFLEALIRLRSTADSRKVSERGVK